jgi:glycosyltransferase involved in cell wall biosynthesis
MIRRTLVVIPAYNAAGTIGQLIELLSEHVNRRDILVVDDGAEDDTGASARRAGVTVLAHARNMGKGAALKSGFRHAVAGGYDAVLTLDADLQHDPACVPQFIDMAADGDYDIIVGTRRRTSDMPSERALANFTSSIVISLFSGTLIHDSQSGYRWIRTEVLKRLPLKGDRYDLESEILIGIGRSGGLIGELPIPTVYGGAVSFINPIFDAARIIRILWSSLFW